MVNNFGYEIFLVTNIDFWLSNISGYIFLVINFWLWKTI